MGGGHWGGGVVGRRGGRRALISRCTTQFYPSSSSYMYIVQVSCIMYHPNTTISSVHWACVCGGGGWGVGERSFPAKKILVKMARCCWP